MFPFGGVENEYRTKSRSTAEPFITQLAANYVLKKKATTMPLVLRSVATWHQNGQLPKIELFVQYGCNKTKTARICDGYALTT